MKKITILITVFFFSFGAFAQTEIAKKDSLLGTYRWITPIIMTECSINGNIQENKELSLPNQKFYIIANTNKEKLIIKIIKHEIDKKGNRLSVSNLKYNISTQSISKFNVSNNLNIDEENDYDKSLINNSENTKYFTVKLSDVNSYAEKYSKYSFSLAVGVLNLPFKFRPDYHGNYDFASSFNLGATIGITLPHYSYTKFKWSILSGYGISNIKLSTATVSSVNISTLDSINSFSALSLSLGAMVEYNKIQAGLFIGCDYLSKDVQDYYKWIYNNKLWFSIGFGYTIFSKSDKIAKQKEEKNK